MVSKIPSQSTTSQNDENLEVLSEIMPAEGSDVRGSDKTKKALSKREIMEQLSRERFPWEE